MGNAARGDSWFMLLSGTPVKDLTTVLDFPRHEHGRAVQTISAHPSEASAQLAVGLIPQFAEALAPPSPWAQRVALERPGERQRGRVGFCNGRLVAHHTPI